VAINGAPYEIVGVMREGFRGLGVTAPDLWAPLALAAQFFDDPVNAGQRDAAEAAVLDVEADDELALAFVRVPANWQLHPC